MKVTNTREPANTAMLHQWRRWWKCPADNLSRPVCRFFLMDFLPLRTQLMDSEHCVCVCIACLDTIIIFVKGNTFQLARSLVY